MRMDMKNVGGTPGGTGTFVLGLIMLVVGGYLLLHQVQVGGNYWNWRGIGGYGTTFGVTLLPLLFGIGILFFNGRSFVGRVLTFGGALVILAGIIVNLDIHFQQTSLYELLTMLVLIVGGIGLIARSVLPMEAKPPTVPPSPMND
jgi:hypothetical protein